MSGFCPLGATPESTTAEWRPKTHVSFRITLPPTTYASTVDVVGSWDDFRCPIPLEQDRRVGRDVWKGVFSQNGGLEMGSEHHYYFLLDQKYCIPDPQSSPSSLNIHPRTGRLISVLYVPIELPPSPEPCPEIYTGISCANPYTPPPLFKTESRLPSAIGSSVFADFDGAGHVSLEQSNSYQQSSPRGVPEVVKKASSFRDRLRVRRSVVEPEGHKSKRRRGWGVLHLSMSNAFLRISGKLETSGEDQAIPNADTIGDIAGYLRSNEDATPTAAYPTPAYSAAGSMYSQADTETKGTENSPGMYSSFYSSEDDENDDEVTTPVDAHPIGARTYPRYYNFDEVKDVVEVESEPGVGVRTLDNLKEQVGGEIRWREEMAGELGYLGSVVL